METLIERAGEWLAWAYALYGIVFLVIPMILFLYVPLLAALVWRTLGPADGRRPWPGSATLRRRGRLAVEIVFGLVNPVLYLVILIAAIDGLRSGFEPWLAALTSVAWVLLAAFWTLRIFGGALDLRSRPVRTGVQLLLGAALACVLLFGVKDLWQLITTEWGRSPRITLALLVLRLCPLYLIPAVLLWDHARSVAPAAGQVSPKGRALFLLPDRAARIAVVAVAVVAAGTWALGAHRRSDASVQALLRAQRESIRTAAARYDVDPRLIASIVYVTHRDQLSPFRNAIERVVINAWAMNMRGAFGLGGPDQMERLGTDENPMLNRALDISVGLAQIKPRTAQTASVLATGLTPDDLPRPAFYGYREVEPIGSAWTSPSAVRTAPAPIPVPADRRDVAAALVDADSNLATCALILALYQKQWEAANPAWSLRQRPDILATLYQIGFARSNPHGAPQSNDFGRRVRDVYDQPWLSDLLTSRVSPKT